jgi:hypothetical protein
MDKFYGSSYKKFKTGESSFKEPCCPAAAFGFRGVLPLGTGRTLNGKMNKQTGIYFLIPGVFATPTGGVTTDQTGHLAGPRKG